MGKVKKRSSVHQLTFNEEIDIAQGEGSIRGQSGVFANAELLTTGAVGPQRKSI